MSDMGPFPPLPARMSRSLRRHHDARMKAKALTRLKEWNRLPSMVEKKPNVRVLPHVSDAREVGKHAAVHGRPCSCVGCKRDPFSRVARRARAEQEQAA